MIAVLLHNDNKYLPGSQVHAANMKEEMQFWIYYYNGKACSLLAKGIVDTECGNETICSSVKKYRNTKNQKCRHKSNGRCARKSSGYNRKEEDQRLLMDDQELSLKCLDGTHQDKGRLGNENMRETKSPRLGL